MTAATYVGTDTTTKGSWVGIYGSDGYYFSDGGGYTASPGSYTSSPPSYVSSWSLNNYNSYDYNLSSDVRSPQRPGSGTKSSPIWYNSPYYWINFTIASTKRISVYMCDFDGAGSRQGKINVRDYNTTTSYDEQTFGSFTGGKWLRWDVVGDVQLLVTCIGGDLVTGCCVMFDPVSSPAVAQYYGSAGIVVR